MRMAVRTGWPKRREQRRLARGAIFCCWLLLAPGMHVEAADAAVAPAASPTAAGGSGDLVLNGDFLDAVVDQQPPGPSHWDRPDGLAVRWCEAPGGGKAIRLDTTISEIDVVAQWRKVGITQWDIPHPSASAVAESYGVSWYSEPMPVEPGMTYRLHYSFRGPPAGVKVWVRGYADPTSHRLWEAVVLPSTVVGDGWQDVTELVAPTAHRPAVRQVRIMLFAYYPAAVYWFRAIRLVREPVTGDQHSRH